MNQGAFARRSLIALWCATGAVGATRADARSLGDIRESGVVWCGGTVRPGLASPGSDGEWVGLEPDLCRAVAVATIGPAGRARFQPHGTPGDPRAPALVEDVAFLTASEMLAWPHLERLLPGPPVYVLTQAVAVADGSSARHLAELGSALICVEPGTGTERALDEFIRVHGMPARMFMFQEDEEREDAFRGGRCDAIAGEAPSLAAMAARAPSGRKMRLLPEPLTAVPIYAVTPAEDGRWAAVVAWTVHTVMANDGDAPQRLPLDLAALGLAPDWQARVLATVGTYADIFARDLGDHSGLRLPRGLTASWREGGASVPPSSE